MVTWIPSIYPLDVSIYIYTSTMDPSWVRFQAPFWMVPHYAPPMNQVVLSQGRDMSLPDESSVSTFSSHGFKYQERHKDIRMTHIFFEKKMFTYQKTSVYKEAKPRFPWFPSWMFDPQKEKSLNSSSRCSRVKPDLSCWGKNCLASSSERPVGKPAVIIAGWWLTYPSEKSWSSELWVSDDIPFLWNGKIHPFMFETTNQPSINHPLNHPLTMFETTKQIGYNGGFIFFISVNGDGSWLSQQWTSLPGLVNSPKKRWNITIF